MTAAPAWLVEFHRQWLVLRGRKVQGAVLAFTRDWEELLDAAGLKTAEDRAAAGREAGALETEGRLILVRQRYRQLIGRVRLPVAQEGWLRGLFGSENPVDVQARSLAVVEAARRKRHPLHPELWEAWCDGVLQDFRSGKPRRPWVWQQPEGVRNLLEVVYALTAREWLPGTLVRDASTALGLDSKALERYQGALEVALGGLFQQQGRLGLEALNVMGSNSQLVFHGPLVLELPGGTAEPSRLLDHASSVTAADLARAEGLTTTARAVLTVENSKSPFRHAVAANLGQGILVVASSFPTGAVRLLLEKLPVDLPHYHFGDTDAAGYLILQKLRQVQPGRKVTGWLMEWRDKAGSPPLTEYDRRVAARLLGDPGMAGIHEDLGRMLESGRKGDFEQENRKLILPEA